MRNSALKSVERSGFGGSYFDSYTHAQMFKAYGPYNFGVKVAQLFASEIGDHMVNKTFTYNTVASKNYHVLPGGTDDYTWYVGGDANPEFRFTELLVSPTSQPGKGNLPFKIAIDKDWVHEPVALKLEGHGLPLLRVLGHPVRRSANSFELEVVVQDGDPNAYIPVSEISPDKTCVRATTFVADELNMKFAADQFGDMFKLQSWVSNYANKAEFTDKFLRLEMGAREKGQSMKGNYMVGGVAMSGPCIGGGYIYQNNPKSNSSEVVSVGAFITAVEAQLEERTQMDREMAMKFGRLEKTVDRDSGRTIKIAPGWDQMVLEGHYLEHNGSLSLDQIFEFLNRIFLTRRSFKNREIQLVGGEAAIRWLHKLIYNEYSNLTIIDQNFVQKNTTPSGFHQNELQFGGQFTKLLMPNGIIITIAYDPTKDDKRIYKTLAPGTNSTLESYCLDILDFGKTEQTVKGGSEKNITMVMQDEVESYFTVSNAYDFESGIKKDGSNAYTLGKECGVFRELSGSLAIWDIERVGRIALNPFA